LLSRNSLFGIWNSEFAYFMLKIIKNAYYRIPNPEFPIPTKQLLIFYNILIISYLYHFMRHAFIPFSIPFMRQLHSFCFTLLLIFGFNHLLNAQTEKILHQTFITEQINEVALNVSGNYTIETWASMDIMTETKISIQTKNKSILDFFIKEGRYEVEAKNEGKTLELVSKKKNRGAITTLQGAISEEVSMVIYVPEEFDIVGNNKLVRRVIEPEQPVAQGKTEPK
jgi:hypothetical protein